MICSRTILGAFSALFILAVFAHSVNYPFTPKADIDMQDHAIYNITSAYIEVLNVSNSTNMPVNWTMLQNHPPCSSTGYAITCLDDSLTTTYFAMDGASYMEDINGYGYSIFNLTNINITDHIYIDGVQLNSTHIPDHNGHTISDTFEHIINRGKAQAITVTKTGGLDINWTAGEIYDASTHTFITTISGSGTLTDNIHNYLKWISGVGLTIETTSSSGSEILIATFSVYDGIISGFREHSIIRESLSDTRRGMRIAFPNRIISGMSVSEDSDVTNALDVSMDAGEIIKDGIERKNPSAINSRTISLVRHFHSGGVWSHDTDAEINTTHYDDGTDLVAIPLNKYVKSYFIFMNGKIGWVFPTEYYNNVGDAESASLSAIPPGLEMIPKLTTVIYKQGSADFTGATWQDIRPGISEESFNIVSDHGNLAGLADDDHTQYVLADGTRNITGHIALSDAGAQVNMTFISAGGLVGCCGMSEAYTLVCTPGAC